MDFSVHDIKCCLLPGHVVLFLFLSMCKIYTKVVVASYQKNKQIKILQQKKALLSE